MVKLSPVESYRIENGELRISFCILAVILVQAIYALDPMYDYRYTLGPEILVPDVFSAGSGFYTRLNEDGKIIFNIQAGLGEKFEAGLKYLIGTDDEWVISKSRDRDKFPYLSMINVGAKFAISQHMVLQADAPIALNKDRDWGGVLTLTKWDGYTKNVSFLSEGRLGFGGAVGTNAAGEDGYVKPAVGFYPNFQIGQSLRISVGTIGSFSVGNFKDDFMIDILPKVEAGLVWFRLVGEVSIGILTWDAERHNRFAVFLVSDI
ncbi:MAG: hypothetical protein LBU89_08660 [Fibromonadaceae bacterium]|jgi:hypothetical protein|nr:hypothetical protein [Fibromonadaceae bacterium]